MKFVKSEITQVVKHSPDLVPSKHVENVARTCYQSEGLITEDSHIKMCRKLVKLEHDAMLEHYHFTFHLDGREAEDLMRADTPFIKKDRFKNHKEVIVSASPRAIVDLYNRGIIKDICEAFAREFPDVFPDYMLLRKQMNPKYVKSLNLVTEAFIDNLPDELRKRHTFFSIRMNISRALANEIVRHRVFAYAQESTRWCNYNKDAFNSELTFMKSEHYSNEKFIPLLKQIENTYLELVKNGMPPQYARDILPCNLKADFWMTGNVENFEKFVSIRESSTAHPDAQSIAKVIKYIIS